MVCKVLLALCLLATLASCEPIPMWPGAGTWPATAGARPSGAWPAGGANPWIPPWIAAAPWYPQWSQCTTIGTTCVDCTTKLVCTKIGGLSRACTDPTLPFCNLGECSATPSEECAPSTPELLLLPPSNN